MKEEIFKYLNPQQVKAVKATEGRVRVVAGAGSGKTRVLTNRYAYLVECVGIDPANILCMTFTNKAAQEMRNRIRKMVDLGTVNDYICTIHGLCVKILRKEIYRIGYPRNFMIVDVDDCKTLMKQVMEEQNITKQTITVNQLLDNVGAGKAQNMDYVDYLLPGVEFPAETSKSSFLRFLQLQQQYYALDFDDLIFFTLYIFKNFPDALAYWQKEFDYIQIDEVQDCSNTDWNIIGYLTAQCDNLFIVGDPDQAIYEWRGAKPDRFVNFNADTDIILDENYRSTPNILNVANSVIKNNVNRVEKNLKTSIPSDAIVIHKHALDEMDEGKWIVKTIDKMIKQGKEPSDFAILYRASNQSRFIEQALMNKQLPYTIWGGIRFFERMEIKDCIAYLRLIQNTNDDISFKRVVNTPSRKFGKAKMDALIALAKTENKSLFETLSTHIEEKPFNSDGIKDFVCLVQNNGTLVDKISIPDLLDKILKETGLSDLYRNDGDEERIENINELINSIRYYVENNVNEGVTLEKYLQDIALFTNSDYNKDTSTIKLMTIHQSKGLEFPYVFIIGLTEGIFPSHRTIRERKCNGLEEERRLMYVAITRAERALFLTESEGYNYATNSGKYPSRFISEIGEDLIKLEGYIDPSLIIDRDAIISRLDSEIEEDDVTFEVGNMVKHDIFGIGEILAVNEERGSCEVDFNGKKRNIQWKFLSTEE